MPSSTSATCGWRRYRLGIAANRLRRHILLPPASPAGTRILEPILFSLPSHVRHVHLYADPISMQWGEKKLGQLCRDEMGIDPDNGDFFLFYNRKKDQIRLFFLDVDGCQMLTKYLPDNAFLLPVVPEGSRSMEIPATLLTSLFKQ